MTELRQKVRRGVIEFFVIFLGVSLSFIADDWREELGEREDAQAILAGIRSDLQQELPDLRFMVRMDSAIVDRGMWLHTNWDRRDLPGDSVVAALQSLHTGMPYSPRRAEYESAKSAGRLQLIASDSLRAALTELYEGWQPHLVNQGATTNRFLFEFWEPLRPYVSFSTEFEGPFVPAIHGAAWEAAQADPVLRSALVYAVGFARLQGRQLTGQVERTEGLIAALDAELAGY